MLLLQNKAKSIIADHVHPASCIRVGAIQVLHWHLSVATTMLHVVALVSHRQCGLCGWSWAGWPKWFGLFYCQSLLTGFGALAQTLSLCSKLMVAW